MNPSVLVGELSDSVEVTHGTFSVAGDLLAKIARPGYSTNVYRQPYLETCCRSALHRLLLVGVVGRPPGMKDGPCLDRLTGMGLAEPGVDGRYRATAAGLSRHAEEIAPHGHGGRHAA